MNGEKKVHLQCKNWTVKGRARSRHDVFTAGYTHEHKSHHMQQPLGYDNTLQLLTASLDNKQLTPFWTFCTALIITRLVKLKTASIKNKDSAQNPDIILSWLLLIIIIRHTCHVYISLLCRKCIHTRLLGYIFLIHVGYIRVRINK